MSVQSGWRLVVKMAFDKLAAAALLFMTSPLIAVAVLALRAANGAPVLFRQVRPGKNGRPFVLMKLRTMRDVRNAAGELLSDDVRLTRVGRIVRAASIDELPQLWNVIRGEMSLVGPRPLLVRYLERYTPEQARRHEVLPGITGWAQINGRNAISWDDKFKLDVWYVDHWSLALDFRILLMTLVKTLRRADVAHEGYGTMPEFNPGRGTKDEGGC